MDDKEFTRVETGTYPAKLINIKDCEVPRWKNPKGMGKASIVGERKGFRLVFKLKEIENAYINLSFADSTHAKSNMFKRMEELHGGEIKEIGFNKKGFAQNEDIYRDSLYKLEERDFLITVQKNGEYTNYVSGKPYNPNLNETPKSKEVVEKKADTLGFPIEERSKIKGKPELAEGVTGDVGFEEEDDIPF